MALDICIGYSIKLFKEKINNYNIKYYIDFINIILLSRKLQY